MIAITKPAPVVRVPNVTAPRVSVSTGLKGVAVVVAALLGVIAVGWEEFKAPIQETCHTRQTIGTCSQVGTPAGTTYQQNPTTPVPDQTPVLVGDVFNETPTATPVLDVFNEDPAPGYTGGDILPPTPVGQ